MNCKQGDLAVIVRALPGAERHIGKVIECREMFTSHSWLVPASFAPHIAVLDAHLRPIRDNPGDDETLTWASKPEAERVPALSEFAHAQRWPKP